MKIFIGPQEVAGVYSKLYKGFRANNVDCDYFTFSTHRFGYGGEQSTSFIANLLMKFYAYRIRTKAITDFFILRFLFAFIGRLLSSIHFIVCVIKYDVFIFCFGTSLLANNRDIPILKFFGKKVIMNMWHGSDMRPAYLDGSYQSPDGSFKPTMETLINISKSHKRRIRFLERNCDYIIGAPFSSSQFAEKPFISFFSLGIPFTSDKVYDSDNSHANAKPIRVLHSPSHPAVKGSAIIKDCIEQLKMKGYNIDYVELTGRPNVEVIEEITKCDLVIDQLYSDTPLAGFATEASWFGKPVIVGGYGLDELKNYISKDMYPPSFICHPDNILEAIETLIKDEELRLKFGNAGREFVRNKWSAQQVAERFMRIIKDDIPDNWWVVPQSINYCYGVGQSEQQTKSIVKEIILNYGVEALQLSDRPELQNAFVKFSETKSHV